jgi:hypothetical protein
MEIMQSIYDNLKTFTRVLIAYFLRYFLNSMLMIIINSLHFELILSILELIIRLLLGSYLW